MQLAALMMKELAELTAAGMKPTAGDIRCIAFGHITRMAIWKLRPRWKTLRPTAEKLEAIRLTMDSIATVEDVRVALEGAQPAGTSDMQRNKKMNQEQVNAIAF